MPDPNVHSEEFQASSSLQDLESAPLKVIKEVAEPLVVTMGAVSRASRN